jgi:hypothetical protein
MNAIIRETDKAHVLTNEAIEVHLLYLRSGLDGVQAAVPVLRDKIDLQSATLDSKIERTREELIERIGKADQGRAAGDVVLGAGIDKLGEKIDTADERRATGDAALGARIDKLGEKIDASDERRAAGDGALGEKLSKLTDVVAEMRGYQKALFWVISLASTGAAVVSIARTFDWI